MKVFNNVIINGGGTPTYPTVFVFDSEHLTYSYDYGEMNRSSVPALAFFIKEISEEVSLFLSGNISEYGTIGYLCLNGSSGAGNIKVYFNGIAIGTITFDSPLPYSLEASPSGLSLRTFTANLE